LIALSLKGSARVSAIFNPAHSVLAASSELRPEADEALHLFSNGKYFESRDMFHDVARKSDRASEFGLAARYWSNAGACSLLRQEYGPALSDFLHSKQDAQTAHEPEALGRTLNNLANLYNQTGNPQAALAIAKEAFRGPASQIDIASGARIRYQMGHALAALQRMGEAEPFYRQAIADLERSGEFDTAARIRGNFGIDLTEAGRYTEADTVLNDGLILARAHRLPVLGIVLRGLARVRSREGKPGVEKLFQEAIDAPSGLAPRWNLFADRGEFRLERGNLRGALEDFREARRLATALRVEVVPADQDRLALEGTLSEVMAGLVDSGNRLARRTGSQSLLEETFDAAEQDRRWSLRALLPSANDWRSRLPARYWDLLAEYRQTEATHPDRSAASLRTELDQLEAGAGGAGAETEAAPVSSLPHIKKMLARETSHDDSVLFSFLVTSRGGWVWAVDTQGTSVYSVPARGELQTEISAFTAAVRERNPSAPVLGAALYRELFGRVPNRYLAHRRWLLELDGPLFDLPFSALVPQASSATGLERPVYLAESKVLEEIPGALLFGPPDPDSPAASRGFLGVGDAIYNAADSRFRGDRASVSGMVLPRLPDSAGELSRCSREWGAADTKILTGEDANLAGVAAALAEQPAVIHFATHVISSAAETSLGRSTGLIALSLDRGGRMGLLGPSEIAARASHAALIVLDGCNSGAGAMLPASGLLGLTRAWIGAGARSVLATRWDVPDEEASLFMVEFYRWLRLRGVGHAAEALSDTQVSLLKNETFRDKTNLWAAYFLLGRQ
jgi:CHAT domain-containing protein/tetratricopeptide (TPR) repeat protein